MPSVQVIRLDDARMIERIKLLDDHCFPVKYSADYYSNVGKIHRNDPNPREWTDLNNVAFYNELLVGSITSRVEALLTELPGGPDAVVDCKDEAQYKELQKPVGPSKYRVYIMTLGVLSQYRRKGIAQKLVQRVVDFVREQLPEVEEVGLHVQQSNEAAFKFYTEKMGFTKRYSVKNYYTEIDGCLDSYYVSIKFDRSKK